VFDWLLDFVGGSAWAYPSIFAIVAIDGFFPLVPGETSVVTGGILASNDELYILLVFAAAMTGAVVGDNISYGLGWRFGERAKSTLFVGARAQARVDWASRQLWRRGPWLIVVSRFIPGGRTATTFSAGALEYPWRRFIAADLVAGALWGALSAAIGWYGGDAFEQSLWKPLAVALAAGLLIGVAGELYVRWTERRASRSC
jgi:membrane protein DedA with SNARE-associated domain